MNILPMEKKHISAVAVLEGECFSEPWSEDGLSAELTKAEARFFVCEEENSLAGYMGMHIILDECYIANVAVFEAFRRRGIGKALVSHCIKTATDEGCGFISLEVRVSNLAAISLYEGLGFVKVGERKNFYSRPSENGLIMTKNLR